MNISLNYFKKIFEVLIWPILFGIGQFIIIIIFTLIFNVNLNLDNNKLYDYMQTEKYQIELGQFLNDYKLVITLIITTIFLPIFIKIYKKYKIKISNKINFTNSLFLILLGISSCFIFNISVKLLNDIFDFTNLYEDSVINSNILITIICAGILGPIIEEYLFRGIVYNKLKTFYSKQNAIILSSLIFSFMHSNTVDMIYAFLMSLIFIYIYEKYQTIKAPIVVHIIANTTIIIFVGMIANNTLLINALMLVIMIIIFIYAFININAKNRISS